MTCSMQVIYIYVCVCVYCAVTNTDDNTKDAVHLWLGRKFGGRGGGSVSWLRVRGIVGQLVRCV